MYVYGGALIPKGVQPEAILAVDPQFRLDDFLAFAASVHRNVHAAVASGDLRSVHALVDETMSASLIARRGEAGWSGPVERLDHTAILDAVHGRVDVVTVRFGAIIGAKEVVEDWAFERAANEYPHLRGVVPTGCSSCGAPLALDDRGDCRHCGTHLVGVGGAWRVTNVLLPRVVEAATMPEAVELSPEHRLDDLLGFARSIYENVHKAMATKAVASIHGVLTTQMRRYLESDPDDHPWGVPIERVDGVRLVRAQRGVLDVVTIRFDAVSEGGSFLEDWTFERPATLPGRAGPAPTVCSFCGAAIALDERGNCKFCSTHMLGVAGDWRLAGAVQPMQPATHPVVMRAMQSTGGRRLLVLFALAFLAVTIGLFVVLFAYVT